MVESEFSRHCRRALEARRRALRLSKRPGETRSVREILVAEYNREFAPDGIRFDGGPREFSRPLAVTAVRRGFPWSLPDPV